MIIRSATDDDLGAILGLRCRGEKRKMKHNTCPDCGAPIGQRHRPGCDIGRPRIPLKPKERRQRSTPARRFASPLRLLFGFSKI